MFTKTTVKKLVKEEINALGLEETLIDINFTSEKSSLEENYASFKPKIVLGIQEGYILNFDLKMINEQKIDMNYLQGLIVHELYHLILHEMHYIFSGEKHRKKDVIKNLHPSNPVYQDGLSAYIKLNDFEEILVEYLSIRNCLGKSPQGFLLNIKHEGFKNIFTYLEHELKELTKDIKEDIKGWEIDFASFL